MVDALILIVWGTKIVLMPGRKAIVRLVPAHTPAHLSVRTYNQICWHDTFNSFTAKLVLERGWGQVEAQIVLKINYLVWDRIQTAKQQYSPLEAEMTFILLFNRPPISVYTSIHEYWCNLVNSRGLYSSIITLKVKYQHGENRFYLSSNQWS